jgi:FixJ family two-component response regulator
MSHATPIVFVVDDDVSARESLEALIRCEGCSQRLSRPHKNSCLAHEPLPRAAW